MKNKEKKSADASMQETVDKDNEDMAIPHFKIITNIMDDGNGNCFVPFPRELIDQLGWKEGDEVVWEETEVCEDWGEHMGYLLTRKKEEN